MGHNHQNADWTFDGTVEVTENLFSLYAFEKICHSDPLEAHPALAKGAWVRNMAVTLPRARSSTGGNRIRSSGRSCPSS